MQTTPTCDAITWQTDDYIECAVTPTDRVRLEGFADVNAAQRRRDGYLQRLRIGIAVFRLFSCFHVGQESSQTALDQCGSLL
jgi:hypothetical protein